MICRTTYRLAKELRSSYKDIMHVANYIHIVHSGSVFKQDGIIDRESFEGFLDEFQMRGYDHIEALALIFTGSQNEKD